MNLTIDLTDPADPSNVISIEVARARSLNMRMPVQECQHTQVRIDRMHAKLECSACGKEINAVEWIAFMAEHWAYVRNLMAQFEASKVSFEAKKRCRCEHCHKITAVRPATPAEVRKFKRDSQQDEGSKL